VYFESTGQSIIIMVNCATGWRRHVRCLILIGFFPQKSLRISGSFVERNLQLKAPYASLSPCNHMIIDLANLLNHSWTPPLAPFVFSEWCEKVGKEWGFNTHTHTHKQTNKQTNTHSRSLSLTHTHAHTHTHTHSHSHSHLHSLTQFVRIGVV